MTRASTDDLDYMTARLHARRSRMAEGERLDELCRVRTVSELAHAVFPEVERPSTADFQRRLVQHLADEIYGCLKHLEGADQRLIEWLLVRFQIENIKVLLRGFLNRRPLEAVQSHIISLPAGFVLDIPRLLAAKTLEEFAAQLPMSAPRSSLSALMAARPEALPAFLLEGALDAGYFHELPGLMDGLPSHEHQIVKPLVLQETNLFQLMMILRGRFNYKLAPELLSKLHVAGAGGDWWRAVLSAPDSLSAAKAAVGIVIDALPAAESGEVDLSVVEAFGWQRYLRLANGAFRRSHTGVGAVFGYFGVRRTEIANLITLSEGIRLGEPGIRAYMLPRADLEAAYV